MSQEHGLTLTEGEMSEIMNIVREMDNGGSTVLADVAAREGRIPGMTMFDCAVGVIAFALFPRRRRDEIIKMLEDIQRHPLVYEPLKKTMERVCGPERQ